MILNKFLDLINGAVGAVVSYITSLWGTEVYPTTFVAALGWIKSLDVLLPITEGLGLVGFWLAVQSVIWGLKWIIKLIDWLPIT